MNKYFLIPFLFLCYFASAQPGCRGETGKDCTPTDLNAPFVAVNSAEFLESTYSIEDLISKVLIRGLSPCGGSVTNIKVSPRASAGIPLRSWGYFNRNNSLFPFSEGIILSTGSAKNAGNFYSRRYQIQNIKSGGDVDLAKVLGIYNPLLLNATYIEFDFVPTSNQISFEYIFASEEYDSSYSCENSDAFALLIKKAGDPNYTNLAVVGNGIPVSVKNIHPENESCAAENEEYFADNNCPAIDINFSGRTKVLRATTTVIPGVKYHFKMVISDFRDACFDSAVFLKAGSFNLGFPIKDENGIVLSDNMSICGGNSQILNADTEIAGTTYQWFFNGTIINGATNSTYTAAASGLYKVQILLPGSTCALETQIKLKVVPYPAITVTSSKSIICEGEYVTLTAYGADIYSYGQFSGSRNTLNIALSQTTTFEVRGSFIDGCEGDPVYITVNVVPGIKSELVNIQFCEGSTGILDAGPGPNYTYLWNTGATTQKITIKEKGDYSVKISNAVCERSFSASVSYTPVPIIEDARYERNGIIIILQQPIPANLEYSIDGGLTWQNSNFFPNVPPNLYYTIAARTKGALCYYKVDYFAFYVSNVFSPNSDGINEEVNFSTLSKFNNFSVTVFDKYGNIVFNGTPNNPVWKLNTYKSNLNTDAYWYQVSWEDERSNKINQKTGWILLKNRN